AMTAAIAVVGSVVGTIAARSAMTAVATVAITVVEIAAMTAAIAVVGSVVTSVVAIAVMTVVRSVTATAASRRAPAETEAEETVKAVALIPAPQSVRQGTTCRMWTVTSPVRNWTSGRSESCSTSTNSIGAGLLATW
ncbi:MAG: hypothetical protein ACTII7_08350, partial [Galactobacter sp.]